MVKILIRPVQIEDAQGMLDVINPIIRAGGTSAIEVEYSLETQCDYIANIGPRAACNVAIEEASSAIVGFQGYELHANLPDHIADISTFVRIGERSRGIGRQLCDFMFKSARANGFTEINAAIRADNFEGLAFYSRMGFRDHSVLRAKPLKNGKRVDRILKRRPL